MRKIECVFVSDWYSFSFLWLWLLIFMLLIYPILLPHSLWLVEVLYFLMCRYIAIKLIIFNIGFWCLYQIIENSYFRFFFDRGINHSSSVTSISGFCIFSIMVMAAWKFNLGKTYEKLCDRFGQNWYCERKKCPGTSIYWRNFIETKSKNPIRVKL